MKGIEAVSIFECPECRTRIEGQKVADASRDVGVLLRCRNGHEPADMRARQVRGGEQA